MLLIISYLRLLDYIALRRVFPYLIGARNGTLYPLPADMLTKVVANHLEISGVMHQRRHDSVLWCLQRGKMFLTGGFLLGCLTGTIPTKETDLDVVCLLDTTTQYKDIAEFNICVTHQKRITGARHPQFLGPTDLMLPYLKRSREEGYMLLSEFNGYLSKQIGIDFIYHSNVSDMLRHVSLFDFSFCRNIYDMRRKKLVIFDLNSIIKKECILSIAREYKHFLRCCNPMINIQRPFDFINQIRMPRINKYRERGYEIKFDYTNVGNEEFETTWKKYFFSQK